MIINAIINIKNIEPKIIAVTTEITNVKTDNTLVKILFRLGVMSITTIS